MRQIATMAAAVTLLNTVAFAQHDGAQPAAKSPVDWKAAEAPFLSRHVQLTSRDRFVKAGEAYFSPDARWIIFQAVPVPPGGAEPDPFYSMYVAKLLRDAAGHVTGIEEPVLISPPGSANTCGWFHPTEPYRVMFGSTLVRPSDRQKSGFQVGTRKYVWMFPDEMQIVTRYVKPIYDDILARNMTACRGMEAWKPEFDTPMPVFNPPLPQYDAECSWSSDGRFVLHAQVREPEDGAERPDADIWVYDTKTSRRSPLVQADGYDGGPFFSPDGKWICYRSDRRGDDRLQLFIAELEFEDGVTVGIKRERQVTDDSSVNWAPYWHPSGRVLVYASSGDRHNYEVAAVEVDPGKEAKDLRRRTITAAEGADVLPAFSNDGRLLMWTSQRGPRAEGEERGSSQLWIAEVQPGVFGDAERLFGDGVEAGSGTR